MEKGDDYESWGLKAAANLCDHRNFLQMCVKCPFRIPAWDRFSNWQDGFNPHFLLECGGARKNVGHSLAGVIGPTSVTREAPQLLASAALVTLKELLSPFPFSLNLDQSLTVQRESFRLLLFFSYVFSGYPERYRVVSEIMSACSKVGPHVRSVDAGCWTASPYFDICPHGA